MSLTRRQVRLLTTSAGDHERLPDDPSQDSGSEDLSSTDKKDVKFKKQHLREVRKAVKGNIAHKSHIVEKYLGTDIKPVYKPSANPVKRRTDGTGEVTQGPENFFDLVKASMSGNNSIKVSDKVRRKLFQKRS